MRWEERREQLREMLPSSGPMCTSAGCHIPPKSPLWRSGAIPHTVAAQGLCRTQLCGSGQQLGVGFHGLILTVPTGGCQIRARRAAGGSAEGKVFAAGCFVLWQVEKAALGNGWCWSCLGAAGLCF